MGIDELHEIMGYPGRQVGTVWRGPQRWCRVWGERARLCPVLKFGADFVYTGFCFLWYWCWLVDELCLLLSVVCHVMSCHARGKGKCHACREGKEFLPCSCRGGKRVR